MYTVYVCTNAEIVCSGCVDDRTAAWEDEIRDAFRDAAYGVLADSPEYHAAHRFDFEPDGNFAAWNGGRHDKTRDWGYNAGLVSCTSHQHVPDWLRRLMDRASQAGMAARDALISRLEEEWDKAEAE